MAGIGLRKPFFAKYSYDEKSGAVSYTGGGLLAKAVEFSASIESSDDNGLYADDMVAETDRSFAGGSISITTDDLTAEASAAILGITAKSVKIGVGEETVQELVYDDSMTDTFLGFGIIIPKRRGGVNCFRAVVFPKIQFGVPEDSAKTKANSIEWQTPTIEGTILRSDAEGHPWKREVTVPDEATAIAYIKQCLGIGGAA